MAYSDNFGQILYQGHLEREGRRQQAEIAQMRWGGQGNSGGNPSSAGDSDDLKWLKAGQEQAKLDIQLKAQAEQLAQQMRNQHNQLFGDLSVAREEAAKKNLPFNERDWLAMRGYLTQQIDPSTNMTWGQALSQGSNGVLDEQGNGVRYTIGSEHDDLVKDNLALALQNSGYNIDYGAEETTMNLGVDNDLSTKEKFQKAGETIKGAFTPGKKQNQPLGQSFGVSDGVDNEPGKNELPGVNPGQQNKPTTFEEGEYSSSSHATKSFTLEQLDDAFTRRDFSAFDPEVQKFIRNYLLNTYVGRDKQGNATMFNASEPFMYLTAAQSDALKRNQMAQDSLNSSFPSLNFDEQRSMFPGDSENINQEQAQLQQQQRNEAMQQQQNAYDMLALTPEAKTARNKSAAKDLTNKLIQRADNFTDPNKQATLKDFNNLGLIGNMNTEGIFQNPQHQQDQLKVANINASAQQPKVKLTSKEKLHKAFSNNKELMDKITPYINGNYTSFDDISKQVMESNAPDHIKREFIDYISKAIDTDGRNIVEQTTVKLSNDETRGLNAGVAALQTLDTSVNSDASNHWLNNLFTALGSKAPDWLNPNSNNDTRIRNMQMLSSIIASGIAKQSSNSTYTPSKLINQLNQLGLNKESFNIILDQMVSLAQINAEHIAYNNNENIVASKTYLKNELELQRLRRAVNFGYDQDKAGVKGNVEYVQYGNQGADDLWVRTKDDKLQRYDSELDCVVVFDKKTGTVSKVNK